MLFNVHVKVCYIHKKAKPTCLDDIGSAILSENKSRFCHGALQPDIVNPGYLNVGYVFEMILVRNVGNVHLYDTDMKGYFLAF